jgi:hemoglobin-like flavoprotein
VTGEPKVPDVDATDNAIDGIASSNNMNWEISMYASDVALVQSTWEQVLPIADTAAQLFYGRLFELDPSLRGMFAHTDMAEQRKKLMQIITVAVRGLERLDELLPAIEAMGRRHSGYGVTDDHYNTVAAALLWTLEQGLGSAFTPQVRSAWTETYTVLAAVMQRGARQLAA